MRKLALLLLLAACSNPVAPTVCDPDADECMNTKPPLTYRTDREPLPPPPDFQADTLTEGN